MLHDALGGVNTNPCGPGPSPFRSSGLPDDFHAFMSAVLAFEEPLSEAELEALAQREMERQMSEDINAAIAHTRAVSAVLAEVFPTLVPSGSAA